MLSHPCKAAAPDHLCRQARGFLQHLGFLSRGCARAFLACRPAPLPPPCRVSASAQRGRELGSVPRQHRSGSAQEHAPSFPRSISCVLSTDKEEGPAVPAPANQRPKRSTQVRLPDRLSALPQHRPRLLRASGCARAGDTTEPWSCWPCSPSLAAHCQPDTLPRLDPQLPSLPHHSGAVTGSCGGSLTALPLLLLCHLEVTYTSITNQTGARASCQRVTCRATLLHDTALPPSCASAALPCKDGHREDDPSPSKHRLVPSCLNVFESCSRLSDAGTKQQISPLASFIPSFQAPIFMSHLQSLQLLLPNPPLQSELLNPLSSSTISSD